jgi:hypothetical protein
MQEDGTMFANSRRRGLVLSLGSAILVAASGASHNGSLDQLRRACREVFELGYPVNTQANDVRAAEYVQCEGRMERLGASRDAVSDESPTSNQHLLLLLVVAGLAFGVAAWRAR